MLFKPAHIDSGSVPRFFIYRASNKNQITLTEDNGYFEHTLKPLAKAHSS
jgi:hypothetical protein